MGSEMCIRDRPQDVLDLQADVAAMMDKDDWAGLGHLIARLADHPTFATEGTRSYDIAVAVALEPIFAAESHAELKTALEPYNAAMCKLPHVPGMTGLYLRALQVAAWRALGTFEGRPPDHEGQALFNQWMSEIEGIVLDTGRSPMRSILLAEPFYHAAFVKDAPAAELQRRFEMVLAADGENPRLWSDRTHGLLPGWFGSVAELSGHMQAMTGALGERALPIFTIALSPCVEPDSIRGWNQDRLVLSLADEGQDKINRFLSTLMAQGELHLAAKVAQAHWRELHAHHWSCDEDWLWLFDAAFEGKPSARLRANTRPISQIAAE